MKHFIFFILLSTQIFAADSYVFLVDTSGSMDEKAKGTRLSKMDVAKKSMKEVVDGMNDDCDVGLVSFSGWLYKPSKINKDELYKSIDQLEATGGTPLGEYMKYAADELLQMRIKGDRGGIYNLIIVTDGEANDNRLVTRYLPEIIQRGLIVKAIGLNMDRTHTLASMANEYINANDPNSLTTSLKKYVAEAKFDDKQATEEIFEELKGIPDTVAYGVIEAMTAQKNHPIGEAETVEIVDPQGNKQTVNNIPKSNTPPPPTGSISVAVMITVIIVVTVLFVFFIIAVMAMNS